LARRRGKSLDRQRVVEAAIACVEAEGPEALGVSRVARELGIKPPSLYNHIGKGDALARAVVVEANRRLLVVLEDAVRCVVDPREQVRVIAGSIRRWARENPGLYAVTARVTPDNEHPEFAPILQEMLELIGRPLTQLGVTGDDTIHAIRGLRAAMHGFLLLENSGQFALAEDSAESFEWLIEAILRGLEPGAVGPGD